MKVYRLPVRGQEREKQQTHNLCAVMGASQFQRRFLDVLNARLTRVADHTHGLADGQTPHFLMAAIQEEMQNIAATAVAAGWVTLALLARDIDRTIQNLWRRAITPESAKTLLPGLHKLLHEGSLAVRAT